VVKVSDGDLDGRLGDRSVADEMKMQCVVAFVVSVF